MLPFYKKYWRTIFDIALLGFTFYLIYLFFGYLFAIASPIIIGYFLYLIIEPFAGYLHKKGLHKIISTTISTILFVVLVGGILTIIGFVLTSQIQDISHSIPKYAASLEKQAFIHSDYINQKINSLPNNVGEKVHEYMSSAITKVSEYASNFLISLPGVFNSGFQIIGEAFVSLAIAFLMSAGSEGLKRNYEKYAPGFYKDTYNFLKENVGKGLVGYLKAQLLLMLLTFIFLYICLLFIRVDNAFSASILSSLFSIVPVIGTATIIVPWILYLLLIGNTALAIKLTIVQLVIVGLRHIVEPKLMANSLGVSAFTSFSFMIVTVSIFNFLGLFLTPIFIILFKALSEEGYFKKWIYLPKEESDK